MYRTFELNRTIFNFLRRVDLTTRQTCCKLPESRHCVAIISGPNVSILTNKTYMDIAPFSADTHECFFCSNSNIGTWDNHVTVWSGMGGSTVNWTFQSHQPNKEMYFRDCRFSEKISKKELQNYDPRNTRSFRRLSCREVCRRQLITLCCHGTTLCFSVVIDRGSVLMSIFSGLCDVWRCTKSDTFITD